MRGPAPVSEYGQCSRAGASGPQEGRSGCRPGLTLHRGDEHQRPTPQRLGGHAQPPALRGPRAACPPQARVEKMIQKSGGGRCPTEPVVGRGSHVKAVQPWVSESVESLYLPLWAWLRALRRNKLSEPSWQEKGYLHFLGERNGAQQCSVCFCQGWCNHHFLWRAL